MLNENAVKNKLNIYDGGITVVNIHKEWSGESYLYARSSDEISSAQQFSEHSR